MIYTVTFNPAIDYVVHTENMVLGVTNRSQREEMYFGGKGINVSAALKELGLESKALGFVAGFTGEAIEKGLGEMGIHTDFVKLSKGNSRINLKIKSKEETELNAQGPDIDHTAVEMLFKKLEKVCDGDILVLAGSIPSSLPRDIYEKILQRLGEKKVKVVVDATKDLLLNTLKYKPFLIKPNKEELEEIFKTPLDDSEKIVEHAKMLQKMGAVNVLVSMAGDGAVLVDEFDKVHLCGVCKGVVKNSVGAGDSMVAGFIAGTLKGDYEYALKLGTATGGATAFSDGLCTKDEILRLFNTL